MFRHQNHHPTCHNDEDIEKSGFHGGHFLNPRWLP